MKVPKYRKHSQKDFAFIQIGGKRIRLPGRHETPESRQAYRDYCHALRLQQPSDPLPPGDASINALIQRYANFASEHYQGSGTRGEYSNVMCVLKELAAEHGDMEPNNLGPMALKLLRQKWIDRGWSRGYINSAVSRIRRMYRWAVSEQIVRPEVLTALESVAGLLPNRTTAKELEPRRPVDWSEVEPVLPHVSSVIRDMIMIQWYTGVRSDSLCNATTEQFEKCSEGYLWRPKHKNQYRQQSLVIPIGPRCEEIIRPYLKKAGILFQPSEARMNRRYGQRYTTSTYRQAVHRGQERAGVRNMTSTPPKLGWVPHQLRHARGTIVRAQFGVEAAQAVLGHADIDATQLYAQRSLLLARQAALELG